MARSHYRLLHTVWAKIASAEFILSWKKYTVQFWTNSRKSRYQEALPNMLTYECHLTIHSLVAFISGFLAFLPFSSHHPVGVSNQNRHIKTVLTGTACVGEAKKEYRGRYSVTYHHTLGNLYQENEKKMSTLLYTQLYSSTSELSVCIDVVEKERDHPSIVVILCTFNFDNGRHHQLLGGWKRYLKDSASQCTSFYYYSAFSALLYRPKDRYSVYSTVGLSAPHRKVKICWWWGGVWMGLLPFVLDPFLLLLGQSHVGQSHSKHSSKCWPEKEQKRI